MKIKTKKQLDVYLKQNQIKLSVKNPTIEKFTEIMREQNKIIEDYIKHKYKEIIK